MTIWIESDTGGDYARKVLTDSTGFFGVVDLPPDRYRVRVDREGREIHRATPWDVYDSAVTDFPILVSASALDGAFYWPAFADGISAK